MKVNNKELLSIVEVLNKDIKSASVNLDDAEARYLVDMYYQTQKYRIMCSNQISALNRQAEQDNKEAEPHDVLKYVLGSFQTIEDNIRKILQQFVESKEIGCWLMDIMGIGPVISAGLIANIDIHKVQTAGQIQAFAGLDPTRKWEKGQIRPWNASLKRLCWIIGQSFVKVQNKPNDIYGHIYKIKKEYYIKKNDEGGFKERADQALSSKKWGKDTEAYKAYIEGKLPKGHIDNMSTRFAVKIFLSHLFMVWHIMEYNEMPAKPYEFSILGHAHMIYPPQWEEVTRKHLGSATYPMGAKGKLEEAFDK